MRRRASSREARLRLETDHSSADISFWGYPSDRLEKLEDVIRPLDVRFERPDVHRFERLTYFPRHRGLYDANGSRVLETCVRRGASLEKVHAGSPQKLPIPSDASVVEEPVVYCGALDAHWGHFHTEGIARLWVLLEADDTAASARLLLHGLGLRSVRFVERLFQYAGIGDYRLLKLRRPTTLAEVFVPQPSFSIGGQAFGRHLVIPELVADRICPNPEPQTDQPVFLSRRLIADRQNIRLAYERKLETMLEERGVRIVSPETLSYEDQIRMFNQHSTFIGRIGSAFHSLLYAQRGRALRTAVFGQGRRLASHSNFLMIDQLKGIEANYIFDPADDRGRWGGPVARSGEPALDAKGAVARLKTLSII